MLATLRHIIDLCHCMSFSLALTLLVGHKGSSKNSVGFIPIASSQSAGQDEIWRGILNIMVLWSGWFFCFVLYCLLLLLFLSRELSAAVLIGSRNFDAGMHSDVHEPLWFKLGVVTDTTEPNICHECV